MGEDCTVLTYHYEDGYWECVGTYILHRCYDNFDYIRDHALYVLPDEEHMDELSKNIDRLEEEGRYYGYRYARRKMYEKIMDEIKEKNPMEPTGKNKEYMFVFAFDH